MKRDITVKLIGEERLIKKLEERYSTTEVYKVLLDHLSRPEIESLVKEILS